MDSGRVRRLVVVLIVFAVLGILTRRVLKSHSLELLHIVVVNAVAQKAPQDYPKSRVYQSFSACLEQAKKENRSHQYMQQLLRLSHHLEKVQSLEDGEVDVLLEELECD